MRAIRVHGLLAMGTLALLCSGGCGDDPLQYCEVSAGRIQGFVRLGVTPVQAKVRATLVASRPGDAAQFDAEVASDGSYELDVPAGRYVLGIMLRSETHVDYEYSVAGLSAGEAPPDTLLVDSNHSPLEVDFNLASLGVHLGLSPELDGEAALVILHRLDLPPAPASRSYLFQYQAGIHNGAADILARGVVPGTYKIEIVIGRRYYFDGEHCWLPGVRDPGASPTVEIAPNQLVQVEGGVGSSPARIQGRITGAWEELGITAPSLSLFALDSTIVRGERPVSDDGSFDERIYLPAPVKVLVVHDGVTQWVGGTTFEAASVFDLQPGQVISGIHFVESGALVEVTAEAYSLVFISLQFYDATTMGLAAVWTSSMAPSPDVIAVPNLRPGNYRLHVDFSLRGFSKWTPQWYDRAVDPRDARIVTIGSEGEVVRIPLVMQEGGTISGTLSGPGYGTDDVLIYVTQADDPSGWSHRLVPAARESFTVEGLPNGRWKVGASFRAGNNPDHPTPAPGTVWYPSTTDWRSARVISIRNFEDVDGIEISLPAAPR